MVFRTTVKVQTEDLSSLSEEEQEKYKAKKEYLAEKFPVDELIIVTEEKEAIVDIDMNLLYVQSDEYEIQIKPLLATDLITFENGEAMYMYPSAVFKGDIDDIYKQLLDGK